MITLHLPDGIVEKSNVCVGLGEFKGLPSFLKTKQTKQTI